MIFRELASHSLIGCVVSGVVYKFDSLMGEMGIEESVGNVAVGRRREQALPVVVEWHQWWRKNRSKARRKTRRWGWESEDTGYRKLKVTTSLSMTVEIRMSSIRKNRGRKTSRNGRRLGKRTEMGQRGRKLVVQLAFFQRAKLVFWRWMLKILQWKQLQRSWITISERRVWGLLSADSGMWAILWKSRMCTLGHTRL